MLGRGWCRCGPASPKVEVGGFWVGTVAWCGDGGSSVTFERMGRGELVGLSRGLQA